jgi:uncharacterized protein (TIGR00730 family)
MSLQVCVFCGASPHVSAAAINACTDLGEQIAERGHQLIYGAGGVGPMGALAASAARSSGRITGVIPGFLRQREQADLLPRQDLIVTRDLFERKQIMIDQADCYIALPGGYGTLDEILEVISLAALGLHRKPIVLVNIDGLWNPLLRLIADLLRHGFVRAGEGHFFDAVTTAAEALDTVEARLAATVYDHRYQEVS